MRGRSAPWAQRGFLAGILGWSRLGLAGLLVWTVLRGAELPDDFAQRWSLPKVAGVTLDLQNASREPWETGPTGADVGERSWWLEWEADENGEVRLVATGNPGVPIQLKISVLQADGTLRALTNLPVPVDGTFPVQRGARYEIAVTGPEFVRSDPTGIWRRPFSSEISVFVAPKASNPDPASAIELSGESVAFTAGSLGSQTGATWWRWRAPGAGTVLVRGAWAEAPSSPPPVRGTVQVFRSRREVGNGILEFLGDLSPWVAQEVVESDEIYLQVAGGLQSPMEFPIQLSLSPLQLEMDGGWGALVVGVPARLEITGRPPGVRFIRAVLENNGRLLAESDGDSGGLVWTPQSQGPTRLQALVWDDDGRVWATTGVFRTVRPSNDDFQRGERMVSNRAPSPFRLVEATVEPGEPEPAEPSVWWRWTAESSGRLRINTWVSGASMPLRVRVFEGEVLQSLRLIRELDPGKERSRTYEVLDLETRAGVPYAISVAGTASSARIQFLKGASIPLNDTFDSRIDLPLQVPVPVFLPEFLSPVLNQGDNRSSWFRWFAPADGELVLRVPTYREAYQETTVYREGPGGLEPQAVVMPDWDILWVPVVRGQTYAISILAGTLVRTNAIQAFPPLMLAANFTPAPENARFEQRRLVEGSPASFKGTTAGADPLAAGPPDIGRKVWYSWIPPESGEALCWVDSGGFMKFTTYSGDRISNLLATGGGTGDPYRATRFSVTRGVPIQIVVTSPQSVAGSPFRGGIGMFHDLVSDSFASRIPIGATPASLAADSRDATRELREPAGLTNSIWWSWKAPANGWLTVAAPTPVAVKVFDGVALADLAVRMPEATLSGLRPKDRYPVQAGDLVQLAASGQAAYDLPFGVAVDFTTLAVRSPVSGQTVHPGVPFFVELNPVDPTIDGDAEGSTIYLDMTLGVKHLLSVPYPFRSNPLFVTNSLPVGLVQLTARYTNAAGLVRASWPVTLAVEPDQDDFRKGETLTEIDWVRPYLLFGATREPGEPAASVDATTGSLWWHWTAPVSGEALIRSPNGIVSVFTGASVDGLERVPILNDPSISPSLGIRILRGVTYHLRMEGRQPGESGRLELQASPVAMVGPRTREVLTRDRLDFRGVLDPSIGRNATVEYRFNGERIGNASFSSAPLDSSVLPGAGIGVFHTVAMFADGRALTNLIGATVYWKEPNDEISRAETLSGTSGYDRLSTLNAGLESTVGTGEPDVRIRRHWWRLQAIADGRLTASAGFIAFPEPPRPSVTIYDSALNVLAGGGGSAAAEVSRGQTYYLSTSALSDSLMNFEFLLAPRSSHDAVSEARPLEGFPATLTVTFGMASVEPWEPWATGDEVGQSLWWTFQPSRSGQVVIESPIEELPELLLRGDDPVQALPVAPGSHSSETLSCFPVTSGERYWLGLGASQSTAWEREIRVHFVEGAINDSLAGRVVLPPGNSGVWVDLRDCTLEPGEPRHPVMDPDGMRGSLWFDWNPGQSGVAMLSAPGVRDIVAYRVTADGTWYAVAIGTHACAFSTNPEDRYLIALVPGKADPAASRFSLQFDGFPTNDNFADAASLHGLHATLRASLNFATLEPGEIALRPGIFGSSVWWRWKAPVSAPVQIRMPSGNWLPVLVDVYSGTNLAGLTRVVGREMTDSGPTLAFEAVAATEYWICTGLNWLGWEDRPVDLVLNQFPEAPTLISVVALDSLRLILEFAGPHGLESLVESSTDLMNWVAMDSGVFSGDLETLEIQIPPGSNAHFFRIRNPSETP